VRHTINIRTTSGAGHVVIEVFATSFGYEPVSARTHLVPPIIAVHADVHDVQSAEFALVPGWAA
jgi:hypothetical protein